MNSVTSLLERASESGSPVAIGNHLLQQAGFTDSHIKSYEELGGGNPVMARVFRVFIAGDSDLAPTSIVKIPAANPADRLREAATGSYEREVNVYRLLRPMQGGFQPVVHSVVYIPDTRTSALLIEDLGVTPASDDFTKDVITQVMCNLAVIHSRFWRDDSISNKSWLRKGRRADIFNEPVDCFTLNWEKLSKSKYLHPFKSPRVNRVAKYLSEHLVAVLDLLDRRPPTLTHGDLHTENMMLRVGPYMSSPVLIDWQDAVFSGASSDVAKFLSTTLTHQAAHKYFDEMINRYFASLDSDIRAEYAFPAFKHDVMLSLLGTFTNYVICATTEVSSADEADSCNWSLRRVSAVIDAVDPLGFLLSNKPKCN